MLATVAVRLAYWRLGTKRELSLLRQGCLGQATRPPHEEPDPFLELFLSHLADKEDAISRCLSLTGHSCESSPPCEGGQ